jgi:hypothetical protein
MLLGGERQLFFGRQHRLRLLNFLSPRKASTAVRAGREKAMELWQLTRQNWRG